MNKNKYIATHHYNSGDTELLNFEQFKNLLLNLMDYEIKRFKIQDIKDEEYKEIIKSLKEWKEELLKINDFEQLLKHYKDDYKGIDLFEYIDLNTSEIYKIECNMVLK